MAHTVGNQVAQAYDRGDRFAEAPRPDDDWAEHVTGAK